MMGPRLLLRCEAVNPAGEAVCWVRVRRTTPGRICDGCWETLTVGGTVSQRAAVAAEPDLPAWAAKSLAADPSPLVRAELAGRDDLDDLDEGLAAALAGDPDELVGLRLAAHRPLPVRWQALLLHSPNVRVLAALAAAADPQVLAVLAAHPDPDVRAACRR